MNWVKDVDSLYDFIGYVVLRAPDRFPVEDFLQADDQMNLERAFAELRRGLDLLGSDDAASGRMAERTALLEASLEAYRLNDVRKGAHLLQDFEALIFKK